MLFSPYPPSVCSLRDKPILNRRLLSEKVSARHPNARQQRRPAPLFVSGSDRERLVVLLASVQGESSICVRPLTQVSVRHKACTCRPGGPSENRLNERGGEATNSVLSQPLWSPTVGTFLLCGAIKTCCLSFGREALLDGDGVTVNERV